MCKKVNSHTLIILQVLVEEIDLPFHVDTPDEETIIISVLYAVVGVFGALTLTAIVTAVSVGVCAVRNKKNKGRQLLSICMPIGTAEYI